MSKVILGGGVSGLSAAYYLTKQLPKQHLTLIESTNRLGGWIKSNITDQNIIFEQGPRTIRPKGPSGINTLKLIEDLGLSNEIIPILSSHPAAKNRMIFVNGKLHSLPSSVGSLFKTQAPFSKPLILMLIRDLFARKKSVKDESIYDFIERRFGSEVANYLISPLICGICAGNAKEISVNFLAKQLFVYEQKYGSISRGLINSFFIRKRTKTELSPLCLKAKNEQWSVYSLKNGLETLPRKLEGAIKGKVDVKLDAKCKEIEIKDKKCIIHLDNEDLAADHVISSISAENLAKLISKQHPTLSELLSNIKNVTVGVVNLCYNKKLIQKEGFGFLVPPKENLPILGVIYDSCCFPNGENTVLTVMMGGHWFEKHFGTNPKPKILLKTAKDQLNTMGIVDEPVDYQVNILEKCIPQYVVGHNENVDKINNYINKNKLPLILCGTSYYGVGVNDVILSASNAVKRLL